MASQDDGFQATQIEADEDDLSEVSDEGCTQALPWGKLMCVGTGSAIDLMEREGSQQFNQHVLGRNADLCDTVLEWDRRISGTHCKLYCEPADTCGSASAGGNSTNCFHVFVENLSGNGTFINTNQKLAKHERRRLNTGDEIALLKPRQTAKGHKNQEKCTFTFLNLRERMATASERRSMSGGGQPAAPPPFAVGSTTGDLLVNDGGVHQHYEFREGTW